MSIDPSHPMFQFGPHIPSEVNETAAGKVI